MMMSSKWKVCCCAPSDFGNGHSKLLYMFSRHVCRSTSVEEAKPLMTLKEKLPRTKAARCQLLSMTMLQQLSKTGEAYDLYTAKTVRRAGTSQAS